MKIKITKITLFYTKRKKKSYIYDIYNICSIYLFIYLLLKACNIYIYILRSISSTFFFFCKNYFSTNNNN